MIYISQVIVPSAYIRISTKIYNESEITRTFLFYNQSIEFNVLKIFENSILCVHKKNSRENSVITLNIQ